MAYNARILKDSLSPGGVRLTTMEVTFPRLVLAEFNTHRTFSRNSASSRAIPVEKKIAAVEDDPFIPETFGKNQKGMQATQNLSDIEAKAAAYTWEQSLKDAVRHARTLAQLGVHKQLANRLIEPFSWQTVLVTATEWDNFYALRCHPDAQPEIRKIAEMMFEVHNASTPKQLKFGEWHMPLVEDADELIISGYDIEDIIKICAGRCARVSYLTHDGKRDPKADIELCERLRNSGHLSPMEHAARSMTCEDAATILEKIGVGTSMLEPNNVFCGNFKGWVSFRKLIPYEDDFTKVSRL